MELQRSERVYWARSDSIWELGGLAGFAPSPRRGAREHKGMEAATLIRLSRKYSRESVLTPCLILAVVLGISGSLESRAAEPSAITSLHAIHTLSKAQARAGLPVAFEATITYYNKNAVDLFVQDGDEAIYV